MKDSARERYPSYLPPLNRLTLRIRKIQRQSAVRLEEAQAAKQPLDPLHSDGKQRDRVLAPARLPNPPTAINKCAYWYEEDLARPDVKIVADKFLSLKTQLSEKGLRFTNTAGNFLAREYHAETERGKLWENAWVARHAQLSAGQKMADIGGASTLFSFYLASIGCDVTVIDNDWANCGTIYNANYVARQLGWKLKALDRDIQKPLPFADNSLDRVFSICVVEHLPSHLRQWLMKEIGRVLRPAGIAGFTTDYDITRPVLVTDRGLRFSYWEKFQRDIIAPSGLSIYGESYWEDACSPESFLGAFFLQKSA